MEIFREFLDSLKKAIEALTGKGFRSAPEIDDDFTIKSIKSSKYSKFIDKMAGQTVDGNGVKKNRRRVI